MKAHSNRMIPCILFSLVLAGSGCGVSEKPPEREAAGQIPAGGVATPAERPPVVEDTLWLEGMPEIVEFRLFQTPAGWPVPFSTYVPPDLVTETSTSPGGEVVRFVAAFAGQREDLAFLDVAFPVGVENETAARERALSAASRLAPNGAGALRQRESGAPPRFSWSLAEYDFAYVRGRRTFVGILALGRHGDHYFLLTLHQPEEWAEGFGPRVAAVLGAWRWEDTGQGLGA